MASLRLWGAFASLKLRYDDFAFDLDGGPRLIAEALGVEVAPGDVRDLVSRRPTKKNVARPHRHTSDMSAGDLAKVEAAYPDYLAFVQREATRRVE